MNAGVAENAFSKSNLQSMPIPEKQNNLFGRIFSIARHTFREAVRDRVLYNLVVFVLLITASAIFLGELTAGHEARMIVNLGLSAMLLFGAFISIFVGVSLVSKEIEKRTVYAIFAKPIGRGEFIVGKYLGLCLTLLVNVLVMGVGVSLALFYVGGGAAGDFDLGRGFFDFSRTDDFNGGRDSYFPRFPRPLCARCWRFSFSSSGISALRCAI